MPLLNGSLPEGGVVANPGRKSGDNHALNQVQSALSGGGQVQVVGGHYDSGPPRFGNLAQCLGDGTRGGPIFSFPAPDRPDPPAGMAASVY